MQYNIDNYTPLPILIIVALLTLRVRARLRGC